MGITSGFIKKCIIVVIIAFILLYTQYNKHLDINSNYNCSNEVNQEINEEYADMIITAYCVIKDKPEFDSDKVCSIDKGTKVESYGHIDKKWYKIKYNEYTGFVYKNYIDYTDKVYIDSNNKTITAVSPDGSIICSDNVTKSTLNYAYNYWYSIPSNIRENFRNKGWVIEITDDDLSNIYGTTYNIIGITVPDEKKIKISNSQASIREALVHEVGHYVDYVNNYVSNSEGFKIAYKEESEMLLNYIDNYKIAEFNRKELFAESFRIYLDNNSELKVVIPKSLNIIAETLEEE